MKRDLLRIADLRRDELRGLLRRAAELKAMRRGGGHVDTLRGKTLAMVFEKASTRTRVSFDVAMHQLGGHALMMAGRDIQIGRGESISDTAHVLSRYVEGIMIRTFDHETILELARSSDVPVINGLTDLHHPCQILADLLTCQEAFGSLAELRIAYVGDGNNVANSWLDAAAVLGFELSLACPEGYDPHGPTLAEGRAAGARIELHRQPQAAVEGAHVVNTDVWASMGQEAEQAQRAAVFCDYQVDADLMGRARPDAIFLHCLPAHRGEEVAAEVIDGPWSRVFDQAENRLHVQKAILEWLMGGRELR